MNKHYQQARDLVLRNNTDLLLIGGVSCIIYGGILAVKQTPKAVKLMEKNKDERTIDKVKKVAPLYMPSILLTGLGIAQIAYSRNITNNKIAAVATAYTVSETALKTYKRKVKEAVEPETYDNIQQEVASDILRNDPLHNKEVIISSKGDALIYDPMSGRYFKGSRDGVDRAVNILNKRMMTEMTMQLNDLYSELDIPIVKMGCELGWNIEREAIDIHYSSGIAEDGQPCLVLEYDVSPIYRR